MPLSATEDSLFSYDVLVLGAGIVGVSTALHLQARGRRVCLIDKDEPGNGTSYGNAGLIERSSVVPYAFPHGFSQLLRYGLNRESDVHYQWAALPGLATWLWRYWRESAPVPLAQAGADMLPLIERCVDEHDALIQAAGLQSLIKAQGWIEMYRNQAAFELARQGMKDLERYQLAYDILDADGLHEREPGLGDAAVGGIHWLDPKTVSDPGGLVQGYARLFTQRGGQFVRADAGSLHKREEGWTLVGFGGEKLQATEAVVALGPDAAELFSPLGYRFPLAHKRGYHLHFQARAGTPVLKHPVCDPQGGYVLAPMQQGIRLTTGVELARPSCPPMKVQIDRARAIAQRIYPLGEAMETQPWMGRRPCMPDMRPVIGPASRHSGLWFNFGHAHHGLTLGPATGRLLAEMMTQSKTFTDPAPYSADRFN